MKDKMATIGKWRYGANVETTLQYVGLFCAFWILYLSSILSEFKISVEKIHHLSGWFEKRVFHLSDIH